MTTYVDPVLQAAEYQRLLLSLLGHDDPAEAQSSTPGIIDALVSDAGDLLHVRPEQSEWSVLECIAHIVDAEIVYSGRYRWILAHDSPDLPGYDQDRWVDALHAGRSEPIDDLLVVFKPLRQANVALWLRATTEERARVGMHRERGPESFDLSFRLIGGHDRFHLGQAQRALEAVRTAG